jgi:hypothetical protein
MTFLDWLILAIALVVLLGGWSAFTATRLDRLHARLDTAQAALDAQLLRRVAALRSAIESGVVVPVGAAEDQRPVGLSPDERVRYETLAQAALQARGADRQVAENEVGRAVAEIAEIANDGEWLSAADRDELHESAVRVTIARRFYNDAVRDTRALRSGRLPRVLHLAGHRASPQFFDIDDTVPEGLGRA